MMGRFIDGIAQCQQSCRETRTYENFPEDYKARDLLLFNKENLLMDSEVCLLHCLLHTWVSLPNQMQKERMALDKSEENAAFDEELLEDGFQPPRPPPRNSPTHTREFLKKIPFW